MLRVREIERRVDLVEDVHGRGLELQERHDQGERDERSALGVGMSAKRSREGYWWEKGSIPLTTAQLGEALLPHGTEAHFDFQAFSKVLPLRRLQFREISREQLGEDGTEVTAKPPMSKQGPSNLGLAHVPVDFGPGLVQSIALVSIELLDGLLDLLFVLQHSRQHLL